jgi:hypothetical protein
LFGGGLGLLGDAARVFEVAEAMCAFPLVAGLQLACLEAARGLLAHEPSRRVALDSAMGFAVVAALRNFPEQARQPSSRQKDQSRGLGESDIELSID